jgi:uncharacterized protein (DUF433 family)
MAVDLSYPHIESPPGEPARLRRLPRIRVAQIVMDHLAHGWSVEEICRQHPHLTPAEAHAAMVYYFDHREQVEDEIRQEWEQVQGERDQTSPSPFYVRMKSKGLL